MHAGTSEKKHNGAQPYLLWEVIKQMKVLGRLVFDFVGARIDADPARKYLFNTEVKKGLVYSSMTDFYGRLI